MITVTPVTDAGILEIHMSGNITAEEYETVLTPAMDAALSDHDRIRLLAVVGPGFDGFTAKAAWADTKMGLRHWTGFDRIAIVTDVGWIEILSKTLGFAFPGPVESFDLDEIDEARRWLTESLGSLHMTDLGNGVLHVQLLGKLDTAAYAEADDRLDTFIDEHPNFSLLLDLREFDGWQGLAALGDHLKLVREHRNAPARVAVVGDESWQKLAAKLMRRFVSAKTRYFEAYDFDDARAFLG